MIISHSNFKINNNFHDSNIREDLKYLHKPISIPVCYTYKLIIKKT